MRDSNWLFPAVEGVHIVALTMLLGAIALLDLRLYGVTMRNKPISKLARELAPWTLYSLIIILATGAMLFASEAVKVFSSGPFQIKMILLFSAMLFQYTVYRKLTNAGETLASPRWGKLAATVSLILWFGIGWSGRFIAFL
jgi:uncharacterized membrane protein